MDYADRALSIHVLISAECIFETSTAEISAVKSRENRDFLSVDRLQLLTQVTESPTELHRTMQLLSRAIQIKTALQDVRFPGHQEKLNSPASTSTRIGLPGT